MIENYSLLLLISIAAALIFDIMNGFHDAANSIATIVSTRVLRPATAVLWAAFFNLVAMMIFGPKVAETISQIVKVEAGDPVYLWVIFSGIVGAFLWDFLTWWLGLPTSSSHALIGGFSGAGVAYGGWKVLHFDKMLVIVEFIFLSPLIGFALGFFIICLLFWICKNKRPGAVDKGFRKGQLVSAALYSIGHGANDAQKTMGIILALLIAQGILGPSTRLSLYNPQTVWIILSCHMAMSLGTLLGGWRIVKTMGMKITKLRPIGGFSAETAGAFTIFGATLLGIPVSTTHTITGAIIGVGCSTTTFSRIKWGIATRIIWAWILTIPCAALIAALIFYCTQVGK
jgi:PiT family inorganic phosphate transporter